MAISPFTTDAALEAYLRAVVLPIVVNGPDRKPLPVGIGSIIANAKERQLLLVTARHNIDHLKTVDQPYGDYTHITMPDIFRPPPAKDQFLKETYPYVIFPSHRGNLAAIIHASVYNPDFDIALFSCILPDDLNIPVPLAIDTNPPQAGMLGFTCGYTSMSCQLCETSAEWEFGGQFSVNRCRVSDPKPEGTSLYRRPCFQIDTPIHSGMSGGPVINFPDYVSPAICGILLSDLSINPDNQSEPSGERAIAASLWISVALSMWIELGDGSKEEWRLLDLIKKNMVKDFGTAYFELQDNNEKIDIIPRLVNDFYVIHER